MQSEFAEFIASPPVCGFSLGAHQISDRLGERYKDRNKGTN